MSIAERVYRRRRELDLSQKQLAEKVRVVGRTVGLWESGKRAPKGDILPRLAAALNTSVAYLIGETDNSALPETDGSRQSRNAINASVDQRDRSDAGNFDTSIFANAYEHAKRHAEEGAYIELETVKMLLDGTLKLVEEAIHQRSKQGDGGKFV